MPSAAAAPPLLRIAAEPGRLAVSAGSSDRPGSKFLDFYPDEKVPQAEIPKYYPGTP